MAKAANTTSTSYRDEILNLYASKKWKKMTQFHVAVHEHFQKELRTDSKHIPKFHRAHANLQDGTLVRYRCLIHNQLESFHVPPFVQESGEEIPAIAYDPFSWPEGSHWWENPSSLVTQNIVTALPVPGEEPWVVGEGKQEREEYGESYERPSKVKLVLWTESQPPVACLIELVGVYYQPRNGELASIYVLSWNIGNLDHPLVPNIGGEEFEAVLSKFKPASSRIREQIISYISECIGGNPVVAEYFFMHLCSTIYKRTQGIMTGKMSVGLTGVGHKIGTLFASRLHACFATLVPRVLSINMHGPSFEKERWVPVKNHDANQLSVAKLQCANQTHLIVNATAIKEGTYGDTSVRNIKALMDIITKQVIYYDFEFSEVLFLCDIPVVIVSEGKSFFQTDVTIPIGNISEDDLVEAPTATEEQLHEWRQYIACARKLGCVTHISKTDELTEFITEDLTKLRERKDGMEVPALHFRINLSRLLGLTHLEKEVGIKEYQRMIETEKRRATQTQAGGAGELKSTAI